MQEDVNSAQEFLAVFKLMVIGCACGVFGGIISCLQKRTRSILRIFVGLVTSAFAGSVTFLWVIDVQALSLGQKVALCCVVGSVAEKFIDAIQQRFLNTIKSSDKNVN